MVYKVPLDEQTLDKIPTKLIDLLEQVDEMTSQNNNSNEKSEPKKKKKFDFKTDGNKVTINGLKICEDGVYAPGVEINDNGIKLGNIEINDDKVFIDGKGVMNGIDLKRWLNNGKPQISSSGFTTAGLILGLGLGMYYNMTLTGINLGFGLGLLIPWILNLIIYQNPKSYAMVGLLFLGGGIAPFYNSTVAVGYIIGMGAGFLILAIQKAVFTKKVTVS